MQEILGRAGKQDLEPGTLVHVGDRKAENVRITVTLYDERRFEEREVKSVDECLNLVNSRAVTWINVGGIHDANVIEKIGNHFGLHPLLLEDILHPAQRPKFEDYGSYAYIVLKVLQRDAKAGRISVDQVSLVLGDGFVITFQETAADVFDSVRGRIKADKGRIRRMPADYLAYSLIDTVVDNYFVMLESVGEVIEALEEELVLNPNRQTLHRIHASKRDMLVLRKSVWPLREVLSCLQRGDSPLFGKETLFYIRDVYDHTIQIIETIEAFRDIVSGMMDIYLSSISNRLNEVMKILTMISTIFMPLTFITGVYGMNFASIPLRDVAWGFYVCLGMMIVIVILMFVYFRSKKWI